MADEILDIDIEMGLTFEQELMADLISELEDDEDFSEKKLSLKLKNAIREVKSARHYPRHYTDEMIASDLEQYYSIIRDVALYDYNMIGAEGEATHSENGISRTYVDRNKLFSGVLPLASL